MSESQPLRRSLQTALAAALVVLIAGVVFAFTQHGRYSAETSLIVLPANTLSAADQANFLETLSRGQVTATMAEVAQSGRFENEAEKAMGMSTAEADDSSVTVTVVPSTSVLLIKSTAGSAKVAETLADRTAALAATYLKTMIKPYTASQVSSAAGTAYAAGTATWMILAGTLAAALAVAVAAQQASYQILQSRRRVRRPQPIRRPASSMPTAGRAGVAPVPPSPAAVAAAGPAAEAASATSAPPSPASTGVGSNPTPSSFSSSNDWSSSSLGSGTSSSSTYASSAGLGSSSSDWKSSTISKGSYPAGSTGDGADDKSQTDSPAPADDAGVTNERVLFS